MPSAMARQENRATRPEFALRTALEHLASPSTSREPLPADFEGLRNLVAKAVRETVLPREYALTRSDGAAMRFVVSNRRLVAVSEQIGGGVAALPQCAPRGVSDAAMSRFRRLVSPSCDAQLCLVGRGGDFSAVDGSCSDEALLCVRPVDAETSALKGLFEKLLPLAEACILKPGAGAPEEGAGAQDARALLEQLAEAFFPEVLKGPAIPAPRSKPVATVVPLSETTSAFLATEGNERLATILSADRLGEAMNEWRDRYAYSVPR